jgi:hypothetical protein
MGLRLEWIVRIEDLKNAGKGNRVLQSGCSLTVEDFCAHAEDYLGGWPCRGTLFLLDY